MFLAFLGPSTYVSINSTVNQQKLPFSDPTHPPLCWRNTWMVPKRGYVIVFNKKTIFHCLSFREENHPLLNRQLSSAQKTIWQCSFLVKTILLVTEATQYYSRRAPSKWKEAMPTTILQFSDDNFTSVRFLNVQRKCSSWLCAFVSKLFKEQRCFSAKEDGCIAKPGTFIVLPGHMPAQWVKSWLKSYFTESNNYNHVFLTNKSSFFIFSFFQQKIGSLEYIIGIYMNFKFVVLHSVVGSGDLKLRSYEMAKNKLRC